ncbi:MAG: flagellar motor switch protein FliN [Firmicutes bacterium]|nr:flagellar motor switch protein FliN [Bacillota bacterium]
MDNNILSRQELEALLKPDTAGRDKNYQDLKLQVVLDFPLEIAVRLGSTTRTVGELTKLVAGAVIELDREIDQPADLIVNGQVVAKGEIVVIEENFGVKITSIIKPVERIEQLRQGGP